MGNTHSSLPTYYNADPTNDGNANSLSGYVDLANQAIGGKVMRASNEKFGASSNLIKASTPEPAGTSENKEDAWVTRRHNPETDWVVIRLGSAGSIAGFDIDTRGLDGVHASKVSIQGCLAPVNAKVDSHGDVGVEWDELLPAVEIGADSRHQLALWTSTTSSYNFVRVTLHPDGGISRLRAFGTVVPSATESTEEGEVDLACVVTGARVVSASNDQLGNKDNLILPGQASEDMPMALGWKTRRSRNADHHDWAVVRLGEPGFITRIELDTRPYDGDQPVAAAIQACFSEVANPDRDPECFWYHIVPRTELNANTLYSTEVDLNDVPFSHIKLLTYPDGGVARLRAFGQRVKDIEQEVAREEAEAAAEAVVAATCGLDTPNPDEGTENEDGSYVVVEEKMTVAATDDKEATTHKKKSSSKKSSKSKRKAAATAAAAAAAAEENNSSSTNEILGDDQFSSRAGEIIQSLTSPVPQRKRARTRSRVEDDSDGSVNTTGSTTRSKRSSRKTKSRSRAHAD